VSEPRAVLRTCVGPMWVGGLSSRVPNDRRELWVGLQGSHSLLRAESRPQVYKRSMRMNGQWHEVRSRNGIHSRNSVLCTSGRCSQVCWVVAPTDGLWKGFE